MKKLAGLFILVVLPVLLWAQPKTPVSQWKNKTILFVGAHPDDDGGAHGTFAMLEDHGNEVYVLTLTAGEVGTKDPNMSRSRLSKIRRQEEVDALKALGVPESHYINLGYTDGMMQFYDKKAVERRIVYWIRKLQPDVMINFDPGYGYKKWHKTDHRAAAVLGTDAARMAEFPLIFHNQLVHDGVKAHWIPEYLFYAYGGSDEFKTTKVDVTPYVDQKVEAASKYISQYSSNWNHYRGSKPSDLPGDEGKEYMEKMRKGVHRNDKNGKTYEIFRYYKGSPDGVGQVTQGHGTHGPGGM